MNFRFSPDGHFLVFEDYSKGWPNKYHITFWNIESKREQGSVESGYWTLFFATDGNSFATCRSKDSKGSQVLLWKMGQAPVLVKEHPLKADQVAFTPDLMWFATANELSDGRGEITMWDMATGEKHWVRTFNQHDTHLQGLSFGGDGKILVALGGGGTNRYDWHWQTTLWDVMSEPKEFGFFTESPTISPNGELLALPIDSGAKLFNGSTFEEKEPLVVKGDNSRQIIFDGKKDLPTISFSPDSKMAAITGLTQEEKYSHVNNWLYRNHLPILDYSKNVARVWDAPKRQELLSVNYSNDVRFSPDSKVLATFHFNPYVIHLWKIPFRKPLFRVHGFTIPSWLILVVISWLIIRKRRKELAK